MRVSHWGLTLRLWTATKSEKHTVHTVHVVHTHKMRNPLEPVGDINLLRQHVIE